MAKLEDLFDMELFHAMGAQGFITVRPHKECGNLAIANYTPKAQYDWAWNEVTVACRGLIFDTETHEVIARPFDKFFNWDQGKGNELWQNAMPPTGPVVRMEKMDGSLGILYPIYAEKFNGGYGGKFIVDHAIATRGSFHSEQAEWATNFYQAYEDSIIWPEKGFEPRSDKTYLFEIIYPANRIVVDYGEYKGLVLIDVIDNETGFADLQEFDDCLWPDKVNRTVLNHGFDSGQAAEIPPGDEGFVYLWPNINFRTKMKSADYIELHRLVSNLSEKSIWEQLVAGKTAGEIKDGLPDEFHDFVDKTAWNIQNSALALVRQSIMEYTEIVNELGPDFQRKDFAQKASKSFFKTYLFMLLDGKSVYKTALHAMKPRSEKPLVDTSEDF